MGVVTFPAGRRHILVVEDVEPNRTPTDAGVAAVDVKPGDLALSDIDMPGFDGHEVPICRQRGVRPAALLSHDEQEGRRHTVEIGIAGGADPWQHRLYEDWASRLGTDRMYGYLTSLRDQFAALGDLVLHDDREALHRLAHDVASTSGMLGFLEVTRCCRAVLGSDAAGEARAQRLLQAAIDVAIDRLDHHFAMERRGAA